MIFPVEITDFVHELALIISSLTAVEDPELIFVLFLQES